MGNMSNMSYSKEFSKLYRGDILDMEFFELPFDESTSIVVCTHDHAFDDKIVEHCLRKPFRYLGLVGSRRKAAKIRKRLQAADFAREAIEKVRSPMGLNIGGQTPGEIAVSVVAELLTVRHGRSAPFDWKNGRDEL